MSTAPYVLIPRAATVVEDSRGNRWTFDMHPYLGPLVLRSDGEPRVKQPGSRSAFWPAFMAWWARHEARNEKWREAAR